METKLLITVISSSLFSAFMGAAIAGLFNLRTKHNKFINDYYKLVIHKRFESYEIIEFMIKGYKTVMFGKDSRPYYLIFDDDTNWQNAYAPLTTALSNTVWLSDEILDILKDFNALLFDLPSLNTGVTEFGKVNYIKLAKLRDELEKQLADDMLNLHEVEKFLKYKKRKQHGFYEVNLANIILSRRNKSPVYI